jgi:1,4-alpha-glucan branching enzyme
MNTMDTSLSKAIRKNVVSATGDPCVEPALIKGGFQWTLLESHGILNASARPRYGVFAPILSTRGLAAFGRDGDSARQVWSRDLGYPGDFRYRDFYKDIGFDLDFDYVQPYLPSPLHRGLTGLKFHAVTGPGGRKKIYDRKAALEAVREHAAHFVQARALHLERLSQVMDRPPLIVCPYDAELFGHWWFEGPEFLDAVVREAASPSSGVSMIDPAAYLRRHPTLQIADPSPSSWGEGGHSRVWLNEANAWIHGQLHPAQTRMSALADRHGKPDELEDRALRLAGNELLLAQASDWPFILRTGSSPGYARLRVEQHLARFHETAAQLEGNRVDIRWLDRIEFHDNVFPELDWRHWLTAGGGSPGAFASSQAMD